MEAKLPLQTKRPWDADVVAVWERAKSYATQTEGNQLLGLIHLGAALLEQPSIVNLLDKTLIKPKTPHDLATQFRKLAENWRYHYGLLPYHISIYYDGGIRIDRPVVRTFHKADEYAEKYHHAKINCAHLMLGFGMTSLMDQITRYGMDICINWDEYKKQIASAIHSPSRATYKPQPLTLGEIGDFLSDLTEQAAMGKLDPLIGREKELDQVIATLCRYKKGNPLLIGMPGVGKTAIVEGLAQKIISGDVPADLAGKHLLSLNITALLAGTSLRGDLENRVQKLVEFMGSADGQNAILFVDEIHALMGAGAGGSAADVPNLLKPIMTNPKSFRMIGATTEDEYRRWIEPQEAFARRFTPIFVDEPSNEEAVDMIMKCKERYERHHQVAISPEAVRAAVSLSGRYIHDRYLPDKALDLLDEASAAKRMTYSEAAADLVSPHDVGAVVARRTGIPIAQVMQSDDERVMRLRDVLEKAVIGQPHAAEAIHRALLRSRSGLSRPDRPIASFLFVGPSGVGKTEMAKSLATCLYDRPDALVTIDMASVTDVYSVSRLIGAPPGYIGHDREGELTGMVRRKPYSVVLLDEVDKAHPSALNILLPILSEGRLRDNHGRVVHFNNTVFIMTANTGATHAHLWNTEFSDEYERRVRAEVAETYISPLLNRLDDVIVFHPLGIGELEAIARQKLMEMTTRIEKERGVVIDIEPALFTWLAKTSQDPSAGARRLLQQIDKQVTDNLSRYLINRATKRVWLGLSQDESSVAIHDVANPQLLPAPQLER